MAACYLYYMACIVFLRYSYSSSSKMQSPSSVPAKRVADGIGLVVKKKRKRIPSAASVTASLNSASISRNVPGILSSVPDNSHALSSEDRVKSKQPTKSDDEFDDGTFLLNDPMPNDTLLCLQIHTRPKHGTTSETCAYVPIFTVSDANSVDTKRSISTHAAPFLPKQVLLHLLPNHAHTNEDIKQLAAANKIRLLQLHGTAVARNGLGWRGDGNDDEDVAVMETCAYEIASRMALDFHLKSEVKAECIHEWFASQLLPSFTGKTWISNSSLESFIQSFATRKSDGTNQFNNMVKELTDAGLLLPRRGIGPNGGEGYWFSLPGLGKAAKSIADGRLSILRRIQSSKFKEKKRVVLEHEIGQPKDNGSCVQAGKCMVLDLLAKGVVVIHETCTGDHFIRIR